MTARAVGFILKLPVYMTIAALKLIVDFIQLQTGDRMVKCFLVPSAVAI